VDVNLKGYLSGQQRHKLTETNLCKKKIMLWRFKIMRVTGGLKKKILINTYLEWN